MWHLKVTVFDLNVECICVIGQAHSIHTRVCWFWQKVSRENRCLAKIFETRPIPPSAWFRWLPESNYGMYWTHKITHTTIANWDPISPHLHRQKTLLHKRHDEKHTFMPTLSHEYTHTSFCSKCDLIFRQQSQAAVIAHGMMGKIQKAFSSALWKTLMLNTHTV